MITSTHPHTASNGLALLMAAGNAIGARTGDRKRIAAFDAILQHAIDCKAAFDIDDGPRIRALRMGIETCVGVFRPLDQRWYERAAVVGGTYARMWERLHDVKPFVAPEAWISGGTRLKRNRLVPGLAVVLAETEAISGLQTTADGGVWWCTSIDPGEGKIVLCQYRGGTLINCAFLRNPRQRLEALERRPARVRVYHRKRSSAQHRDGWDDLVDQIVTEAFADAA